VLYYEVIGAPVFSLGWRALNKGTQQGYSTEREQKGALCRLSDNTPNNQSISSQDHPDPSNHCVNLTLLLKDRSILGLQNLLLSTMVTLV
jgi:hypothetical protein